MIKQIEKTKSPFSLICLIAIMLWFSIFPFTKKWENVLSWDVFGYYLYLPATVIWEDTAIKDFSKVEETNNKYENTGTYYQGSKTEEGAWMIKYTMGFAVLESPFFLIAHKIAPSMGYEADGFSLPYQKAMLFAHFFYLIIGLIFLRKALLKLFTDRITTALLLILFLGTNFLLAGMLGKAFTPIHTIEFSLFAIVLYLTIVWHESPSLMKASLLGLTIGLVIIVRPSDIVILFLPILWGIQSFQGLIKKAAFIFKEHKTDLLLFLLALFIALFPQLYYWKSVAGNWILFSYNNNPGEGFDFFSPYVLEVLFSFRKGWLLYTPVMIFSIMGFYFLFKNKRELFWAVFIFFITNLYIISSWSCWWYAGSFSQRAMVDSYAFMLIPLGYFLNYITTNASRAIKLILTSIIVLLIVLNVFQSWQYSKRIIHSSRMTAEYYFKVFGKTSITESDEQLLSINHDVEKFSNENEYNSKTIFAENYDNPAEAMLNQYSDSIGGGIGYCLRLDSNFIFTPKFETTYHELTHKDHAWIRSTFSYYSTAEVQENSLSLVVTFVNYEDKLYNYKTFDVPKQESITKDGAWTNISFDCMTPEVRSKKDKLNIYFWYKGKAPIYIDDFKIEVFEKK